MKLLTVAIIIMLFVVLRIYYKMWSSKHLHKFMKPGMVAGLRIGEDIIEGEIKQVGSTMVIFASADERLFYVDKSELVSLW